MQIGAARNIASNGNNALNFLFILTPQRLIVIYELLKIFPKLEYDCISIQDRGVWKKFKPDGLVDAPA